MELDDAYANRAYIAGADDYPPRWDKAAKAFREKLGARAVLAQSYGGSERQKFDLFLPEELEKAFDHAFIQKDGQQIPLVTEKKTVFEATEVKQEKSWFVPQVVFVA